MQRLAIYGKEDIRWEIGRKPEPDIGEVRLRVKYVGICGSDLHYYFDGTNGENVVREALTPGHELSAVVDFDPSDELTPGTPVTVHPARFGPEVPGLEHKPYLRPGGDYLGSASTMPHRQGGASEYLVVRQDMIRVLPAELPLERAALAEPFAVALHAVQIAGNISGMSVLVTGAGPIGLLTVAAAANAGASRIAVSDVNSAPLARAKELGASEGFIAGRDTIADEAYDVVFECSGAAVALSQAVRAVRRTGRVVQVGILPNTEIGVNLAPILAKEVTIHGTFRFSSEIDEAISILAKSNRLDVVITHVIPARDAVSAFDIAKDASASAKVLLDI
ncbi:zinc-binding dehydrogenase [Spelaeicoccus albus]|uniref:L-idonate 5-dehydrogenase n=1 Tax=Spelaeicoccus albus TaxID=1280376 RepID=A0A7Z0D4K6_9MICO|nr:zinc-binding dehydrogenase [Spelaeicoccus albus]NYI68756.1 L-idonate 5-dehydrogenase [Spelaeicoccus albus]